MYLALARLTALAHLCFIAFLVAGGPIGLAWREVVPAHLTAIAIALVINLTGSDCPLTVLEKHWLKRAGLVPYHSGFISHYLVEPVHAQGIDGRVNLLILSAWIIPTALAYALFGRRSA